MKNITKTLLVTLTLLLIAHASKHRRKVKKHYEEKLHEKLVKRYDDLQYDPYSMSYETFPQQQQSTKSNIPFGPFMKSYQPSTSIESDPIQDIPLGPIEEADNARSAISDGNVHLKDLLSFIRKTNIPEDPFAPPDAEEVLPSQGIHSPEVPLNSIGPQSMILKRYNVAPGIPEQRRLFFPQQRRLNVPQIPQRSLLYNYLHEYPYQRFQSQSYVRKSIIPNRVPPPPLPVFPLSQIAKKSEIPKPTEEIDEDPYEELKRAITKKKDNAHDTEELIEIHKKSKIPYSKQKTYLMEYREIPIDVQRDNIPRVSEKHVFHGPYQLKRYKIPVLEVQEEEDPYEELKRAISKKEEDLHDKEEELKKARSKQSEIPYKPNPYMIQYRVQPINVRKENILSRQQDILNHGASLHTYNANDKKMEIPGITIEHYKTSETNPPILRITPEQVRKDLIPDNKKAGIIGDANNNKEVKKSENPYAKDTQATTNIYANQADKRDSIPVPKSTTANSEKEQLSSENSNKYTVVMAKKSSIPQSINEPSDSTPLVLRKYPAESISSNSVLTKKSSIPETTVQKVEHNSDNGQEDNNLYQTLPERKSELPSAEVTELSKVQREMKLINEISKMKKSVIPKPNTPQDSTPLVLRRYPAESTTRDKILAGESTSKTYETENMENMEISKQSSNQNGLSSTDQQSANNVPSSYVSWKQQQQFQSNAIDKKSGIPNNYQPPDMQNTFNDNQIIEISSNQIQMSNTQQSESMTTGQESNAAKKTQIQSKQPTYQESYPLHLRKYPPQ